ncbi:2OG-Fe(II) oxygenase [Allomuricauda sp. ARW1Y1]|uniref:2OG-Fe(II) oxygenase n=1 Tax=Allomuricauda sp. ARW1Y1 TaxID=2663843 RepID=UPI001810FA10|nr:2OG-Fe(II) oxygenase [Muricauda sp. ARW1Y1]NYJ28507.1 SM-20-related protein [Muricauda sp. ARW1Y1]
MNAYHGLEDWLSWMDDISSKDYVIIDHFLRDELYTEIKTFFLGKLPSFKEAGIGAHADHQIDTKIRGDFTYWLDRNRDAQLTGYWSLLDETMHIFNRYCYLSLSGYEFHLAHYPSGGHYDKHLDQFENRNNRMISMIIYLNDDWKQGDGGELEIFEKDGSSFLVEPLAGRCVMFKSAEVPHAVLKAHKSRFSLTGWLLHQPSSVGKLFV